MEKVFEKLVSKLKRKYTVEKIGLWAQLSNKWTVDYKAEKLTMEIIDKALKDLYNSK